MSDAWEDCDCGRGRYDTLAHQVGGSAWRQAVHDHRSNHDRDYWGHQRRWMR